MEKTTVPNARRIGFICAAAAILAIGCGLWIHGKGPVASGSIDLVNPDRADSRLSGEPAESAPEGGFVYDAYFGEKTGDFEQQQTAHLEKILNLYDSVQQTAVTYDPAAKLVQVTVSVTSPLTAQEEEAIRSMTAAHFPEAQVELTQAEASPAVSD